METLAWYCKQAFLYGNKKQISEEYNPMSSTEIQNYPNITCEYSFLIHPILDYILWVKMGRNSDPSEMNPYKYNFKKIVLSLLSSDELFVFVKGMLKRIMAYSDNSKDKIEPLTPEEEEEKKKDGKFTLNY